MALRWVSYAPGNGDETGDSRFEPVVGRARDRPPDSRQPRALDPHQRSVRLFLLQLRQRQVVVQGVGDQQAHVGVQRLAVVAHQERVFRLLALCVDLQRQTASFSSAQHTRYDCSDRLTVRNTVMRETAALWLLLPDSHAAVNAGHTPH